MKIGILLNRNSPISRYLLNRLSGKIKNFYLFYDNKKFSKKDKKIFIERTKNKLNLSCNFKKLNQLNSFYNLNHSSKKFKNLLVKLQISYLLNFGTPRILKSNILNKVKNGVINIHPALIQLFRGCTNVEWAIFYDKPIGLTAHLMTKRIDYGPIILQHKIRLSKKISYSGIRLKLYEKTAEIFEMIIDNFQYKKKLKTKKIQFKRNYFKPINEIQMKKVFEKLKTSTYKFQNLKKIF